MGCSALLCASLSALVALELMAPGVAQPARVRDPDWPCQQIKVPELSLAAVWSGPPVDTAGQAWRNDPAVADLVGKVAPRRVPIDAAVADIDNFAKQAGQNKASSLPQVMAGLFNTLGQERDSVMAGLDRFGKRQKELAAQIRAENEKLRTMQSDPSADPGTVEALTRQVTWDAELFQDRNQALSYACDVPNKIEKRLFALARAIQNDLD